MAVPLNQTAVTSTIKVLSFNAWFLRLPFGVSIAEDIDTRLSLLPQAIADTQADVVLLQEVWDPAIRKTLTQKMIEAGYPYHADSWSGLANSTSPWLAPALTTKGLTYFIGQGILPDSVQDVRTFLTASSMALTLGVLSNITVDSMRRWMGNGLVTYSKFPTLGPAQTMKFSTHTRPDEYFVSKGALKTQVVVPGFGPLDVYNTHLGAVSFRAKENRYDKQQCENRLLQTMELKQWVDENQTSEAAVLGGDLNSHLFQYKSGGFDQEFSSEYRTLSGMNGGKRWSDTYRLAKGFKDPLACTDHSQNEYKKRSPFRDSPDTVIDYIWASDTKSLRTIDSKTVFRKPISLSHKKKSLFLSDHFGVLSTLSCRR